MSNGDAGIPSESGPESTERDLRKELTQASEIGRLVLNVTKERTENPQFSVRRYTMPMLDLRGYSPDTIKAVVSNQEQITDDNIRAAREASVALAVESAVQIVEAKPTSSQVIEDSDSLGQMFRVISRSAGFVVQTEATDQQAIVKAGRAALGKRNGLKGLENAGEWDDQKVAAWAKEMFKKAGGRLRNSIDALEAYHRR